MANEVSVFGTSGGNLDLAALAEKAHESAQDSPRGGGAPAGSDYFNFSGKTGRYTIGKDSRRVSPDELWVLDVTSFESGWVCWKDGKPKATRLANIYNEPPVPTPDMDEFGPFEDDKDGWSKAKAFVVKSLSNGQQGYFKNNSASGVSAISDLQELFAKRAAAGEAAWPVFGFAEEEFTAKGFKNFKPKFEIAGWLDNAGMAELTRCIAEGENYDLDELFAASAVADVPVLEPSKGRKRA